MDNTQVELIAEQINRIKDNSDARLKRLEVSLQHYQELDREKLEFTRAEIAQIKKILEDHETRIRTMDDSVTTQKSYQTIATAGQAALTLIASAIAAWLGGQK